MSPAVRHESDDETFLPVLSMIGPHPLVTPKPLDRLHPATLARVSEAEAMVERGANAKAIRLLIEIERDLGVTAEDRILATIATEDWEADLERGLALAAATANGKTLKPSAPEPEAPIVLSDAERGYDPGTVKRFDKIERKLSRLGNTDDDLKRRDQLLDERAHLEATPGEAREQRALADRIAETVALAEGRGSIVAQVGDHRRITDHDSLYDLYEGERLSHDQFRALLRYRQAVEKREPLGAATIGDSAGGAHDHEAYVERWVGRSNRAIIAGQVERAVALKCIARPWALQMLRWVAGQRGNITAMGKGRAYGRHLEGLKDAADIAIDVFKRHDDADKDRREAEQALDAGTE